MYGNLNIPLQNGNHEYLRGLNKIKQKVCLLCLC